MAAGADHFVKKHQGADRTGIHAGDIVKLDVKGATPFPALPGKQEKLPGRLKTEIAGNAETQLVAKLLLDANAHGPSPIASRPDGAALRRYQA